MATKVETFDTKEERNARWEELRKTTKHVARFSGIKDTGQRKKAKVYPGPMLKAGREKEAKTRIVYQTTYSVAYPQPVTTA